MANKKSKTTSRRLTITRDIIEDCLSSWLTATGFIARNEFVIDVIQLDAQNYFVDVKNGQEEKED